MDYRALEAVADSDFDCATRGASELESRIFNFAGRPQASIRPFIWDADFSPRASERPLGGSTAAEAIEAVKKPKPTTTIINFFICIFLSALCSHLFHYCDNEPLTVDDQ